MARAHRPTPDYPDHLRALYERFPWERSIAEDPLSCVRPFAGSKRSAEVAGIVAATLAIGNTTSIRRAFSALAERVDGDLLAWVDGTPTAPSDHRLEGFKHRWIRADQMRFLAARLHSAYASYDSLEDVYREGHDDAAGPFAGGLDALARSSRGPTRSGVLPPSATTSSFRAASPLGESVQAPHPVRPVDGPAQVPDLALWTRVSPEELRIPLDQHVYWIAYHLGLTHRRSRSWATVEEVTEALRRVDPLDPVKFDFVLCHTGISGDCPKRRDVSMCGPCAVRPDCLLWRGRAS